jgi:hypothetical protein
MYLYVLISLFAISFLGAASMVGYKFMVLRRREVRQIVEQPHSLEYHLGAFLRNLSRVYATKAYLWIKNIFLPIAARIIKEIVLLIVATVKKIKTKISARMELRDHGNHQLRGAVSFFLKNITEHKKNLRNKE